MIVIREPVLKPVEIAGLRPTQITVVTGTLNARCSVG
jgi:hypothetical protein